MATRRTPAWLAAAWCGAVLLAAVECRGDVRGLSVSPSALDLGMFSAGARVRITGRVPLGSETVIAVRGAEAREVFSRKSRFGIVWVTGGKVEVSGVPALFLTISPRPLPAILSRDAIEGAALDSRALAAGLRVDPPEADGPDIRDAYLRLKVDDGSYLAVTGGYRLQEAVDGEVPFAVDLEWPVTAAPGPYRVLAYECRERRIVGVSSASLEARESGLAAGLKRLANERGGLYGVLAVAITLSVGFGLDLTLARVRRRRRGAPRHVGRAERDDVEVH